MESGEECGRVRMVTNWPVRGVAVIQVRDSGGVEQWRGREAGRFEIYYFGGRTNRLDDLMGEKKYSGVIY